MYLHTCNYHLNVVGPRSAMLCDLFKEQSVQINAMVDKVGRHIRAIGYKVPILTELIRINRLNNPPVHSCVPLLLTTLLFSFANQRTTLNASCTQEGTWPDENGMLEVLLTNHETIIRNICNDRCARPAFISLKEWGGGMMSGG
jgi:hypothetical protein